MYAELVKEQNNQFAKSANLTFFFNVCNSYLTQMFLVQTQNNAKNL